MDKHVVKNDDNNCIPEDVQKMVEQKMEANKNHVTEPKAWFAVENYFIIHTSVSDDRTDYNTLIPLLEKHKNKNKVMKINRKWEKLKN